MRSLLGSLVILSLWIPRANAQSAVLIGIHIDTRDNSVEWSSGTYRTVLITFRNGRAQLAADVPDLMVPRKDGFWRVGTLRKGDTSEEPQEFVFAAPIKSTPHAVGEYHPPNPEWNCSEVDQATIEFVNPNLLSVSYSKEPACSLEEDYWHGTYKIEALQNKLDVTAVLGASAWDAMKKADARAKKEDDKSSDCVGITEPDQSNWGIQRSSRLRPNEANRWVAVSDFNAPHVCGGGDTYEINFPIPESLTGSIYRRDALVPLLKSKVAKSYYILRGNAFLTPAGDFLVNIGNGIAIFAVKQSGIEPKPILSVPMHQESNDGESNVVMIQWALGKHVAEWESEFRSLQQTHLPEPIVATGTRQGSE